MLNLNIGFEKRKLDVKWESKLFGKYDKRERLTEWN